MSITTWHVSTKDNFAAAHQCTSATVVDLLVELEALGRSKGEGAFFDRYVIGSHYEWVTLVGIDEDKPVHTLRTLPGATSVATLRAELAKKLASAGQEGTLDHPRLCLVYTPRAAEYLNMEDKKQRFFAALRAGGIAGYVTLVAVCLLRGGAFFPFHRVTPVPTMYNIGIGLAILAWIWIVFRRRTPGPSSTKAKRE